MTDEIEEWLEVQTFGSPYVIQIGSRTGRRRWRKYGDTGEWKNGNPPPRNRRQFEP
jgi:hypothetical protein